MKKIAILMVALLALTACGDKNEFDATGTFEATEVTVSAEASGKVLVFTAEEGTSVQSGEELGVIDTMQLYLQREQLMRQQTALLRSRPDVEKTSGLTASTDCQTRAGSNPRTESVGRECGYAETARRC